MAAILTLDNFKTEIQSYTEKYELRKIDVLEFLTKVELGIIQNMTSEDLVKFCSECAASLITVHSDYSKLAAVIMITYHQAVTLNSFSEKIRIIKENTEILNEEIATLIIENGHIYDSMIDYNRDFNLSYFSINSLIRSYMIKIGKTVIERPQDVFMRTAIQIHRNDFERVKTTYDLISMGYYTHGTPTLFNSCLKKCQLASCFLLAPEEDSLDGIYNNLKDCAIISKYSGGLGMSLHEIRSKGSLLKTTGGYSKGIIPVMKIINETMNYVNIGGIRRNSTIAFYLEPWHRDIFDYLDVRKNSGNEEMRAREIFTALWVNDLFMERVEKEEEWSLFDPNEAKGLADVWGDDFKKLYLKYEKTISRKVVPAQKLFRAIINAQIETGTPYILYKDTANKFSNQQNLGTIKSSNLCAEIIQYSAKDETAVCNLASICLPKYVKDGRFDFNTLKEVVKMVVFNLNRCIDSQFYPIEKSVKSNIKHRPIGIGIQGLADTFAKMRYPFDSQEASELNRLIAETMYFAAIEASVEISMSNGPYSTYMGSPLSKGIFQFEMYNEKPSGMWNWEELRTKVRQYGVRNSLFIAYMPTAGTSQLFGNSECFEPYTSNIFTRRTVAGEFQIVNSYLMEDLERLGMWNEEMKNIIVEHEGSIQNIPCIPKEIKNLYKTVWEIKMKTIIDLAAGRQPFVDQAMSMNVYLAQPTFAQLSSMHFYGWRKKLKTGMYYLRTKPISKAIKFTVDQELVEKTLSSMGNSENVDNKQDKNEGYCEACSC